LPFCVLIIVSSLPFIANSFALGEGSPDPGGLPFRYLLKAIIPTAFFLLVLQGVAHTLGSICTLIESRSPKQPRSDLHSSVKEN
jgi:TRAP-type mannitol/chloroaromatic compound transport system permease small subunit